MGYHKTALQVLSIGLARIVCMHHIPYMTVYLVKSLPKIPHIHRIYMVEPRCRHTTKHIFGGREVFKCTCVVRSFGIGQQMLFTYHSNANLHALSARLQGTWIWGSACCCSVTAATVSQQTQFFVKQRHACAYRGQKITAKTLWHLGLLAEAWSSQWLQILNNGVAQWSSGFSVKTR